MKKLYIFIQIMILTSLLLTVNQSKAQITWTEYPGNPVYGEGTDAGTPHAELPSIIYDDDEFSGHGESYYYKMWYDKNGTVAVVYSNDGINWVNDTDVLTDDDPGRPVVNYYPDGFTGMDEGDDESDAAMYYRMWYLLIGNNSTVGGAARTHYHDYNTGETYSDHFGGMISEVMLFNTTNATLAQSIYNYINDKYGESFTYPVGGFPKENSDDWIVIDREEHEFSGEVFAKTYPNPFSGKGYLWFEIPEKQSVNVELLDMYGSVVKSLHAGSLPEGPHEVFIDGSDLSSGVYMYRIKGQNFVKTGKVIVNK